MSVYRGKYPLKIKSVASIRNGAAVSVTLNNGDKFTVEAAETGGVFPTVGKAMNSQVMAAYARGQHSAPRVKKNPVNALKMFSVYAKWPDSKKYVLSNHGTENDVLNYRDNLLNEGAEKVKIVAPNGRITYHIYSTRQRNNKLKNKAAPRVKKNPLIPGITARPVKGKRQAVFAVEYANAKTGPWSTAGIFRNRTLSDDYAKSMHEANPAKWWRVVLK